MHLLIVEAPAMSVLDPLAVRVARRHHAAVVLRDVPRATTRMEYSSGGRISAVELMRMLEPTTGPLVKLRFRASMVVDPNGVEWEALDENANVVSGRVVLHAAVAEDEVISWAAIETDRPAEPAARVAIEYQWRRHGLEPVGRGDEENGPVEDREVPDARQPQ